MRTALMISAASLLVSTPAAAQAAREIPAETVLCLDVSGRSLPPICKVPGSRLNLVEDICLCPEGLRVVAPICPPGVKPPRETATYERARRRAAQDGSLHGDHHQGRPMCAPSRVP